MRPWKAGWIVAAATGATALVLIVLARWADVRLDGFDVVYASQIHEWLGISVLFLIATALYLLDRTSRLSGRVAQIDRLVEPADPIMEPVVQADLDGDPTGPGADVSPTVEVRPAGPVPATARRVRLAAVSKVYDLGPVKVHALRDVNLDIPPGSLTVILGPSGSGKTTLLNLLGGIDRATSGQIWVDGTDVSELHERQLVDYRREQVGFVFQFFNLIPSLTARENVALAAELTANAASVEDVLRKVGLADRMDHFPAELSGGEQQRVAIARALVKNPPLLLCDEPTGELDYVTGVKILEVLRAVAREGRAVIVVTHNAIIGDAAELVVHLRGGRIDRTVRNPEPVAPRTLKW